MRQHAKSRLLESLSAGRPLIKREIRRLGSTKRKRLHAVSSFLLLDGSSGPPDGKDTTFSHLRFLFRNRISIEGNREKVKSYHLEDLEVRDFFLTLWLVLNLEIS